MDIKTKSTAGAIVAAVCLILTAGSVVSSANAAVGICRKANDPSGNGSYVHYDVNGKCSGEDVDTWRVKVGLAKEDINWGPIPNDWPTVSGSYSSYSTWAARGANRYKENLEYCSDLPDHWKFKSVSYYQVNYNNGVVDGSRGLSGEKRFC